jgi:hypothetical protein
MSTAELIFKYRKAIYRLTKVRIEIFAVNGIWYRIENWDANDEQRTNN